MITLSDRAAAGVYADRSGALLDERAAGDGRRRAAASCCADGIEPLAAALREEAARGTPLVLCTGGTGFGPRDLAPEALAQVATRDGAGPGGAVPQRQQRAHPAGVAEPRACALVGDDTLVMLLPGSPKAVAQGMDILGPLLPHALAMMRGLPHA